MKLSQKQQEVVDTLLKYPKELVMFDGWITGGHGIKFDMRTIRALRSKGIIDNDKLSPSFHIETGCTSKTGCISPLNSELFKDCVGCAEYGKIITKL